MHLAAELGQAEVVRRLLAAGAPKELMLRVCRASIC